MRDPRTDGYTIIVHPCQDIHLLLTDPSSIFKNAVAGDKWEVSVYSEYFYLDSASVVDGQGKFNFIQLYDLTPWTNYSSVYLGDIEVTLNSKTAKESFSLCVIARSYLNSKNIRVITAVNPEVNRLKLDLDDILEVVVTKDEPVDSKEMVWCSLFDMGRSGTGNGDQWFEKLRQEVVFPPSFSPMPCDSNNLYCTISRSLSELRSNPNLPKNRIVPLTSLKEVQSQHHFWFRVRPEHKAAVLRANSGLPMANVVFNSTSGVCSNLQILISTRGTRLEPQIPEHDKERREGKFFGLLDRRFYPSSGRIVNPDKTETIEMLPGKDGILVELAPLTTTWPHHGLVYRWDFNVEPVVSDDGSSKDPHKRLACVDLADRSINNQPIQRFRITPNCDLPNGEDMVYLGDVNFWYDEQKLFGKKKISCWLVKNLTIGDEYNSTISPANHKSILLPGCGKVHRGGVNSGYKPPRQSLSLVPYVITPPVQTQAKFDRIVVKITEQKDDNMIAPGATVVSFQQIKIDKKNGNNTCATNYTHEDCGNNQVGVTQKKNTKENQEKIPITNKKNNNNVGGSSGNDVCIIADPPENALIKVRPGQDVVIRLPVKNWEINSDISFYWMFNLFPLGKNNFFIKSQRMIRDGRRLTQEITISPLSRNFSREIGEFTLGGIQCHNGHEKRYIAIQLIIEDLSFSPVNEEYSKSLYAFMKSLQISKAASKLEKQNPLPNSKTGYSCNSGVVTKSDDKAVEQKEDKTPTSRKSKPTLKYKIARNLVGGESFDLRENDELKVTINDKTIIVASKDVKKNWECSYCPTWLCFIEFSMYSDESSFIFRIRKNVTFPNLMPDKIHFKCGDEILSITVFPIRTAATEP